MRISILFVFIASLFFSVAEPATTKVAVFEPSWPREFTGKNGKLVVYAPQIEKWENFKKLEARLAVAFAKSEREAPALGSFKITADTEVDHESRLVKIVNVKAEDGKFPSLQPEQTKLIMGRISTLVPKDSFFISLDRMIANMEREAANANEVKVKNDPPKIFLERKAAILVLMDGPPVWSPIKENDLKWAVNTNWPLFSHEDSKKFYLLYGTSWLETSDLQGTWMSARGLPASFSKLPAKDKNWEDVRKNIPGKQMKAEEFPRVFYSEEPAELIVIQGDPKLEFVKATELQYVSNTESDLFFYPSEKNWYFLVSGRWFRSSSMNGSWEYATSALPDDFRKILADHPRGDVRASVPGTREADEAIILAAIPQQGQVEKSKVSAQVQYAGEPKFNGIEGTSMTYAVNTSDSVIKVGDMYYLCYQAVWFVSASPKGPWQVADSVPREIYTIPASSPVHNVTYVQIYDSTPTYVTVGYTAGYYGAYYYGGSLVYGTGYYYPPYYYYAPGYYYPYYYGWNATYGAAAWYNPYTGSYRRGAAYYGPYGGAGYAARYNPTTGTYARGGYAYGPYSAGAYREAYNPRTDTYARTRQGTNYYSNWGSSYVRRGDDWARTGHVQGQEAGAWGYQTSNGNKGFVGSNGDDLYAGRNGDVYRKTDDGWQQWDNGGWNSAQHPERSNANIEQGKSQFQSKQQGQQRILDSKTFENLNHDLASRTRGAQNSQKFNNWRSSGGASRPRNFSGGARPKRR